MDSNVLQCPTKFSIIANWAYIPKFVIAYSVSSLLQNFSYFMAFHTELAKIDHCKTELFHLQKVWLVSITLRFTCTPQYYAIFDPYQSFLFVKDICILRILPFRVSAIFQSNDYSKLSCFVYLPSQMPPMNTLFYLPKRLTMVLYFFYLTTPLWYCKHPSISEPIPQKKNLLPILTLTVTDWWKQ